MSIAFPLAELFANHQIITDQFRLQRRQEHSRSVAGEVFAKDLGDPIFVADFRSREMYIDDAMEIETLLNSLDGSIQTFEAHDTRRPYPRDHADGTFNDAGVINSINANRKAITLSGLDANFSLRVGDKLRFVHSAGNIPSLHEIVEAAQADGAGLTPEFEIRPHLPDAAVTTTAVTLKRPSCWMKIEPGSVSYQPRLSTASVSFRGVQAF